MASVTWATFKAQIARKLDDTSYRTYSTDLLLDAVNDALEAFAAAHTGVASDIELTGDGTTYEFDLPGNIIEEEGAGVYAVHWEKSTWLTRLEYWPGKAWPNASRSTSSKPLGYILWPQGKISFSRVPTASQTVTIHYVAYYAEVVDDDSTLTVPRWARSAIKHFVCAEALEPGSAKARWPRGQPALAPGRALHAAVLRGPGCASAATVRQAAAQRSALLQVGDLWARWPMT